MRYGWCVLAEPGSRRCNGPFEMNAKSGLSDRR